MFPFRVDHFEEIQQNKFENDNSLKMNPFLLNTMRESQLQQTTFLLKNKTYFPKENKSRYIMLIVCQADDSHEMSKLFSMKKKQQQQNTI